MYKKRHNSIKWLEFSLLQSFPKLRHAIFLRHGGHSKDNYSSLNVAYDVGDDSTAVSKNLKSIQEILYNEQPEDCPLYWAKQTHGKNLAFIDKESPEESLDCDALLTDKPYKILMIKHADCQATVIYDPVRHAVANVHSGWKGSVVDIYKTTIEAMKNRYNSDPKDLIVCVGPSLGPTASEFKYYKEELPKSFWDFQISPNYFDFWAITAMQLLQSGIQQKNIEMAKLCTYSHPEDFYSYRRDRICGRHGSCVLLLA